MGRAARYGLGAGVAQDADPRQERVMDQPPSRPGPAILDGSSICSSPPKAVRLDGTNTPFPERAPAGDIDKGQSTWSRLTRTQPPSRR